MKLIIPMAGMGKRMRPHTLTTPKPLIKVAGKSIVHWLITDIVAVCGESIDEIGFVVGLRSNTSSTTTSAKKANTSSPMPWRI